MRIRLQFLTLCMAMAALSQLAVAAGASVENPRAAAERAGRDTTPGKHWNNPEKKPAQSQSVQASNSYAQEIATISAQADAAEAACASQSGENRLACRKQVSADRERAVAAAKRKHDNSIQKK
jgi:hypothetical protein